MPKEAHTKYANEINEIGVMLHGLLKSFNENTSN